MMQMRINRNHLEYFRKVQEANKDVIKSEIRQKRAKHAVYENQRTIKAVAALKNNDIEAHIHNSNCLYRGKSHNLFYPLRWQTDP